MGWLSSIISRISSFFDERRKARSAKIERRENERRERYEQERIEYENKQKLYRIGNDFEDYVITMFDPSRFILIHRTPTNDDTNGRFVHSMVYPDLRFKEISTGRKFWVEVKYRAHSEDDWSIRWCTDNQLRNYKKTMYKSKEPVFIIMGVGGSTQNPNNVYCLNLDRINFTLLYYGTYAHNKMMDHDVKSLNQLYEISLLKK